MASGILAGGGTSWLGSLAGPLAMRFWASNLDKIRTSLVATYVARFVHTNWGKIEKNVRPQELRQLDIVA